MKINIVNRIILFIMLLLSILIKCEFGYESGYLCLLFYVIMESVMFIFKEDTK